MAIDFNSITAQFQLPGPLISAVPYGSGHINDTYLVYCQDHGHPAPIILQRINHHVFKQPELLMDNITRVTRYARERILAEGGDPARETLTLIPTRAGGSFYCTPENPRQGVEATGPRQGVETTGPRQGVETTGQYWRAYTFIPGARTYDRADNLHQVKTAARAFGNFQKLLDSLPGERLHETIPDFHHTRKRFEAFQRAVRTDAAGRAHQVQKEIDFILQREADASLVVDLMAKGSIPERVTHNDTKLNNVLIDDQTGEGICVIDLDTMMPGSALYDFGDLVRMGAATAAEDEPDLERVGLDLTLFEALAHGYLDSAGGFLTPLEQELLPFGGRLITFEQAIRFLGDYLNGDVYYKIHRPGHNLDRARTQIKLVAELERNAGAMEAILSRAR